MARFSVQPLHAVLFALVCFPSLANGQNRTNPHELGRVPSKFSGQGLALGEMHYFTLSISGLSTWNIVATWETPIESAVLLGSCGAHAGFRGSFIIAPDPVIQHSTNTTLSMAHVGLPERCTRDQKVYISIYAYRTMVRYQLTTVSTFLRPFDIVASAVQGSTEPRDTYLYYTLKATPNVFRMSVAVQQGAGAPDGSHLLILARYGKAPTYEYYDYRIGLTTRSGTECITFPLGGRNATDVVLAVKDWTSWSRSRPRAWLSFRLQAQVNRFGSQCSIIEPGRV